MAKQRTEKSMVSSRYSAQAWVTPAQYLTELICEKKAGLDKRELPQNFWSLKDWNAFYRQQILAVYKLLKLYHWVAVSRALHAKPCWNVYSYRAPHLLTEIKKEHFKYLKEQEALSNAVEPPPLNTSLPGNRIHMVLPSEKNRKKSKLELLREMDEEDNG